MTVSLPIPRSPEPATQAFLSTVKLAIEELQRDLATVRATPVVTSSSSGTTSGGSSGYFPGGWA